MAASRRGFLTELVVFVILSAGLTLVVAVIGIFLMPRPEPPVVTGIAVAAGCFDALVVNMIDAGPSGSARLCILDDAVRPSMRIAALRSGHAYTAWLQYFDRPGTCQTSPCGVADLVGEDPIGVLSRMDAVVANGTGNADLWGDLRDLHLSPGAQVRLVLSHHGAANGADNRARARQLLTLQVPRLGAPLAGAAADGDVGMAVAQAVFDLPGPAGVAPSLSP